MVRYLSFPSRQVRRVCSKSAKTVQSSRATLDRKAGSGGPIPARSPLTIAHSSRCGLKYSLKKAGHSPEQQTHSTSSHSAPSEGTGSEQVHVFGASSISLPAQEIHDSPGDFVRVILNLGMRTRSAAGHYNTNVTQELTSLVPRDEGVVGSSNRPGGPYPIPVAASDRTGDQQAASDFDLLVPKSSLGSTVLNGHSNDPPHLYNPPGSDTNAVYGFPERHVKCRRPGCKGEVSYRTKRRLREHMIMKHHMPEEQARIEAEYAFGERWRNDTSVGPFRWNGSTRKPGWQRSEDS